MRKSLDYLEQKKKLWKTLLQSVHVLMAPSERQVTTATSSVWALRAGRPL